MLRSRLLAQFAKSAGTLSGLLAFTALSYLPGCMSSDEGKTEECEDGSEGCACFGNETCLKGLVCLSTLCVDPDGKEPDAAANDDKPSKGSKDDAGENVDENDDAEEDDAEDDSSSESSSDDGSPQAADDGEADEPATHTSDEPPNAADASVVMSADDGEPTSDDATDPSSDEPAADDTEIDPDVTEPDVTDPATDPSVDPPAPECTDGSGSCAQGGAMDCVAGAWAPRDCSACEILSCGAACCGSVWSLVAETYPYVQRDDARLSYTASSEQASVSAAFESIREFAAIVFTLDSARAIAPASVSFVATTVGTVNILVSLELDELTGCLYDTSGGALISENVCWGEWETTGFLGPVQKILIRAQSEEIAQTVSLSVSSVAFAAQ